MNYEARGIGPSALGPHPGYKHVSPEASLRDKFAMAAMTGLLAQDKTGEWSTIVNWAYDIAEIALRRREERT